MKANPPLRCPWHRGSMIGDVMLDQGDMDELEAMLRPAPSTIGRMTPPVPHEALGSGGLSPTKYAPNQKAFPYGLDYQEMTSHEEMLMIGKMLVLYDIKRQVGKWCSYYLSPLWPIVAFLVFLYCVWRFGA